MGGCEGCGWTLALGSALPLVWWQCVTRVRPYSSLAVQALAVMGISGVMEATTLLLAVRSLRIAASKRSMPFLAFGRWRDGPCTALERPA